MKTIESKLFLSKISMWSFCWSYKLVLHFTCCLKKIYTIAMRKIGRMFESPKKKNTISKTQSIRIRASIKKEHEGLLDFQFQLNKIDCNKILFYVNLIKIHNFFFFFYISNWKKRKKKVILKKWFKIATNVNFYLQFHFKEIHNKCELEIKKFC